MSHYERQYLDLLRELQRAPLRPDRTGTGTRAIFGTRIQIDLAAGFPLLTTKRLHWPSIAQELFWFAGGHTNVKWLQERGVTIWDEWADENGELGEVYGAQWRAWLGPDGTRTDQLGAVIAELRRNPTSRRLYVSAWNAAELPRMALPPCHVAYQFYVDGGTLSTQFSMRSVDTFLGLPFNVASYALLTHLVAHACDLTPGQLIFVGGDTHLYANHAEQAERQLARAGDLRALPTLTVDGPRDFDALSFDHLTLSGYDPLGRIKAPVSV